MKNIVFMGTPQFSVPILEALMKETDLNIQAVVTQPDRKVGRKKKLTPPPVKKTAEKFGLTILQPEKIAHSEEMDIIIDLNPDLIITAAFGQFLPKKLLDLPKYGAINVHASLLPKYRGAAPIHYAIINGEKETGITIMYMTKEMDAGDILTQRTIPIRKDDDTGKLFESLSLVGRDLLIDTLPDLFANKIKSIPQDPNMVSYAPMIGKEQERIDWNKTAEQLDNKVRGMRPFPGAFTYLSGQRFKIWATQVINNKTEEKPATIISLTNDGIEVACGEGTVILLTRVQPAGKGQMSSKQYLLGADIEEGMQFG